MSSYGAEDEIESDRRRKKLFNCTSARCKEPSYTHIANDLIQQWDLGITSASEDDPILEDYKF